MAGTMDPKVRWFELFRPGDFSEVSPVFSFAKQVTIRAVGMLEDDEITIHLVKLSDGKFPQWCDCIPSPGEQPKIESTQPLTCPDCVDGETSAVRLTPGNPVIVIDAPQNTYMVAIYHGDGIGTASVMAQFGTTSDVSALSPAMRGCPECEVTPTVYYATVELPDGGLAYRDGQQDPAATVEIRDCDDELVGWIYPAPTDGATTEVKTCEGELLGYAVNGVKSSSSSAPVVNNSTEVNIPSTIQISGMPGLQITSMPELKLKLEVPKLAVSMMETHGDIWILYNDGSMEKSTVKFPQDAEIEKTVLISFGGAAEDIVVKAGERFELPTEAVTPGLTGWRLGDVIYSPGYTLSRRFSTTFEAVY